MAASNRRFLEISSLCLIGSASAAAAVSGISDILSILLFAAFIISGVSSLMFFELRRTPASPPLKENAEKTAFPRRPFFIAVPGIAAAVTVVAIPLYFFLPRLQAKSGAPPASDTASSYVDFIDDIETMELGRPGLPQQPETIVMRVKTDAPEERRIYDLKWRGLSYDYYDGRAWTLRRREERPVVTQGRFYKLEDSAMDSRLMRQTFFMEETLTNTVYAARRALAVSSGAGFLRRDSSDNLFARFPEQGRTNYTVVSDTIFPDIDRISDLTHIPDDIRSTWLQLPELDPRIVQLALEITRGYERKYDKAHALETWLRSNYTYAWTPPLSPNDDAPEDGDRLAYFLFGSRAGHCEYFATAMTVMLRAVGIPARLTVGFLAGEYNPVGGSWTVRRKHAHAWTEAWFPPYGWIEFDAVPAGELYAEPARARFFADLADAVGLWWRENVAGYDADRQYSAISGFFTFVNQIEDRAGEFLSSFTNRVRGVFNLPPQTAPAVKIAALIALFIAVSGIIIFRRTKRRIAGIFRPGGQNSRGEAADFYAETLTFLKSHGFIPEKTQTPLEFVKNFGTHPAAAALLDLTLFYNKVRFGDQNAPFPRDEARSFRRSLKTAFE